MKIKLYLEKNLILVNSTDLEDSQMKSLGFLWSDKKNVWYNNKANDLTAFELMFIDIHCRYFSKREKLQNQGYDEYIPDFC